MTTITLDVKTCLPEIRVDFIDNEGSFTNDIDTADIVVMISDGDADDSQYQGIIRITNKGGQPLTISNILEAEDLSNLFSIAAISQTLPKVLVNDGGSSFIDAQIDFDGTLTPGTYSALYQIVNDGVNWGSPFVVIIEVTVA